MMTSQNQSFLEIIHSRLDGQETVLPVFDTTAQKIQLEAAKQEPDTKLIEKMISCDPSLTSQVLRISNSAFYKGLQKVSTVRNAIIRLGSREIANIAILECQKKQFSARNPVFNDLMQKLWRHSVGCALSAQWLAIRCGFTSLAQEAFTAGLLHDIGKLLILAVTDELTCSGTLKQMPAEVLLNEVLDNFHTEYGFRMLSHWELPELYSRIARDHHLHEPCKDNVLMLVRLANKTTNSMGIGLQGPEPCVLAATPEADYFGLSEIALAELEIKLEDSKVFW